MSWKEVLYNEEDKYTFCQYSSGEFVRKNGFEAIEYICEIPKNQTLHYKFLHFNLFLSSTEPEGRMDKFEKYLKENDILYKTHIWQKPLI